MPWPCPLSWPCPVPLDRAAHLLVAPSRGTFCVAALYHYPPPRRRPAPVPERHANHPARFPSQVFPLFIASQDHGLGLAPHQLGAALSPMGISVMCVPLIAPRLLRRFGAPRVFRAAVMVQLLVSAVMPWLRLTRDNPAALWSCLIPMSLLRGSGGSLNFVSTSVMLNELITHRAGYYNGLNDAVCSFFRALAPMTAGSIFAASTRSPSARFPFNEHLAFLVVSAVCLVCMALSLGSEPRRASIRLQPGAADVALSSTHVKQ